LGESLPIVVVQPDVDVVSDSAGMVALPPGAVTVKYKNGSDQPALVLLVETAVLQKAPAFDVNSSLNDQNWFDYWNQYIPTTVQQTP
jgi:hypothetical protein